MEELRTLLKSLRGKLARADAITTLSSAASATPAAVALAAGAVDDMQHAPHGTYTREEQRTLARIMTAVLAVRASRAVSRREPKLRLKPQPEQMTPVSPAQAAATSPRLDAAAEPAAAEPATAEPAAATSLFPSAADSSLRAARVRRLGDDLDALLRDAESDLEKTVPDLPDVRAATGAANLRAAMSALRRAIEYRGGGRRFPLVLVRNLAEQVRSLTPTSAYIPPDERAAYAAYAAVLTPLATELESIYNALSTV